MLHLIRSKGFDFLGNAPKFVSISAVARLLCLGVLLMKGQRNLGADFRGGDLLVISAAHKLTPDEVRGALAHTGFQNSVIQSEKVANRDLISIRADSGAADKSKRG
jgi:preprotein translocase subunit SecF